MTATTEQLTDQDGRVRVLREQLEVVVRQDMGHGIMALALLIAEINAGRVEIAA